MVVGETLSEHTWEYDRQGMAAKTVLPAMKTTCRQAVMGFEKLIAVLKRTPLGPEMASVGKRQ